MRFRARSWTAGDAIGEDVRFNHSKSTPLRGFGISRKNESKSDTIEHGVRTGIRAIFRHQGKSFFLLLFTWIAFIAYIRMPRAGDDSLPTRLSETTTTEGLPPANLHLVVPASKADPNLCKVMLSAAIAGYPAPVIINWEQDFSAPEFVEGGSHLAKIKGVHEYLDNLNPSQDDDLVLMVDGYDIWLQLRPETLIKRYFDVNRRADARIASKMGRGAMAKNGVRQEVIFGCQKRCWPWTHDDPPCYAVPQSSLPEDVYGPQTDTDIGDEANPYIKFRPRFINSGVSMGTVKAMRKLFKQALVLLPQESNMGSDQYIFSHILGDQEVWREIVRRDSAWIPEHPLQDRKHKIEFNPKHIEEVRAKAAAQEDGTFEFGIGLDYASEIGLNTVFAEDDTAWLHWNDEHSLREAEDMLGINSQHSRMQTLAADIQSTPPPFWTFNHDPRLPRKTSWSDVSLFTNVWTGIAPAVIHHNAHRDGRKALREEWWDRIWFSNHTRDMYDAVVHEPVVPLARAGYNGTTQRDYWPSDRRKGVGKNGVRFLDGVERVVRFDEVCNDYHEELFRDGKGPWVMPEIF